MCNLHILLAVGDKQFSERLSQTLRKNNYHVEDVYATDALLNFALCGKYALIIIDTDLTPGNDFSALSELRKNKISEPILVLSTRRDVADKVEGLDRGADDYLCKPFSMDELLARVRALSRRTEKVFIFDLLNFGDIYLDTNTNELICNNSIVRLGVKEFQIIKLLISNGRQILPKETMIEKIWGFNSLSEYNNVEVYVSFVRKKLAKIGSGVSIRSIRGIGYQLTY